MCSERNSIKRRDKTVSERSRHRVAWGPTEGFRNFAHLFLYLLRDRNLHIAYRPNVM